jgi:geranylgeranyl pyrophosphate synthase
LRDLLGKSFSGNDRDMALAIVRSNSGIAHAIETASEYVAIAESECAKMPASRATTALREAPRALLNSVIR